MNETDLVYALHGLLTASVFIGWFYFFWQDCVIERGRQRLFEIRDRWFDLVTPHAQWRGHTATRAVRILFNTHIRWLHKLSLPAVLLTLVMPRVQRQAASKLIDEVLRNLPDPQLRAQARLLQNEAMRSVCMTMLQRSLTAWVIAIALMPIVLPLLVFAVLRSKPYADAAWSALLPFSEAELTIAMGQDPELRI